MGEKKNNMPLLSVQSVFQRHKEAVYQELQRAVESAEIEANSIHSELSTFYGQIKYHLGWIDEHFQPASANTGKYLRPTLLLLAYEVAGADGTIETTENEAESTESAESADYLRRALPIAAAIELTHCFTLIHDDIEDGDEERRHRPTLWKVWGVPQAINTGDGLFSLARMTLWKALDEGVASDVMARLGILYDRTCLAITEGQHLDLSFEEHLDIPTQTYLQVIERKTAALISCSAEMGAMLATSDQDVIERLRRFGHALGLAFQVRDDILGVWATQEELGKTPAGDIYRRKKSLPIIHALAHASLADQQCLHEIYRQRSGLTEAQVEQVLAIFERTGTKEFCYAFLEQQCHIALEALSNIATDGSPVSAQALDDLKLLVRFVSPLNR
jgi:geranylgeranyl diphosphate synthase type I